MGSIRSDSLGSQWYNYRLEIIEGTMMKKICIVFMTTIAITMQASQPESKLAELEKVVTEIATYAPKVITEGKQIYTELQPVIQKIKQYLAEKKAAKTAMP